MSKLRLTDTERLILSNQYEILSKLASDDQDLAQLAKNLRAGHVSLYQDRLHIEPDLDPAIEQHVYDILTLHSLLQSGYEQLTDKSGIDQKAIVFDGFDGNNEGEMLSFARALCAQNRYGDVLGSEPQHVVDSHSPTREVYARMIAAWRALKPKNPFSKETINAILAARRYPGN